MYNVNAVLVLLLRAAWLAFLPHSRKVGGSSVAQSLSVWSLHIFPVCGRILRFLPKVQKHAFQVNF